MIFTLSQVQSCCGWFPWSCFFLASHCHFHWCGVWLRSLLTCCWQHTDTVTPLWYNSNLNLTHWIFFLSVTTAYQQFIWISWAPHGSTPPVPNIPPKLEYFFLNFGWDHEICSHWISLTKIWNEPTLSGKDWLTLAQCCKIDCQWFLLCTVERWRYPKFRCLQQLSSLPSELCSNVSQQVF